jgi:hypothetical protein
MKRIRGYVVSMVAAGVLVGAALPACATNDQTIFVESLLAPSASRQGGGCTYTNDPQQARQSSAILDLGLTDSYSAELLIGNQLIPRGDPQNNRAESNRVHLNGAVVKISDPGGGTIREFTSLATSFLDPQNNNTPGFAPMAVTVFDAPTKDLLIDSVRGKGTSRTVLVSVNVFGQTLGGKDVETGDFQFPMLVCRGCLVNLGDGYDPLSKTQPKNCDKAADDGAAVDTNGPCIAGQDRPISCRNCRGIDVCDPNAP